MQILAFLLSFAALLSHILHIMRGFPRLLLLSFSALAFFSCKEEVPEGPRDPDPVKGKNHIIRFGCTSCHEIPGVSGRKVGIGPSLDGLMKREVIGATAGLPSTGFPNTPENLEKWLQNPRSMNHRASMPRLGIKEMEAKDIVRFLTTYQSEESKEVVVQPSE